MVCKYFKKSEKVGSCPFSFSCKEECFFVYKQEAEGYEKLSKEVKYLRDELFSKENEISCLEADIDESNSELNNAEDDLDRLLIFCKNLLKFIDTEYYKTDILAELDNAELGWGTQKELERVIGE